MFPGASVGTIWAASSGILIASMYCVRATPMLNGKQRLGTPVS
jgi:hypothetical protein